jgi:hypothetical protein
MSAISGTSSVSPYVQQYDNLQVYDNAELMSVSFGSPENAQANVLSVLSQWAALQSQEQSAFKLQQQNIIDLKA